MSLSNLDQKLEYILSCLDHTEKPDQHRVRFSINNISNQATYILFLRNCDINSAIYKL